MSNPLNVDFCPHECNTLYKALRYYQINKSVLGSKEYQQIDLMLQKLQPHYTNSVIEPAYQYDR